jgi:hypothetical protein
MGFLVKVLRFLVSSVLLTAVFAGCANIESKRSSGELIGQMNLAEFETFQCMDSIFIGSDFRESQIQELRALSHKVLREALTASGYQVRRRRRRFLCAGELDQAFELLSRII